MLKSQKCIAFLGHKKSQSDFFVNQRFLASTSLTIIKIPIKLRTAIIVT